MWNRLEDLRGHALRLPVRVIQGFVNHRGTVRAASLSYTSLLALVPLLAVVLSVSKVFVTNRDPETVRQAIDRFLDYAVPQVKLLSEADAAQATEDAFGRIQEWIDRINAGALGAFGAITLVTVGISLLSAIEKALNDVWGVRKGRTLARRIVYYWSGVTLGPILIFFSIGLTSSDLVVGILGYLPGGAATAGFHFLLPVFVLGIGFTLLYWTMPNTVVPFRSALAGGLTAGALFQLNNLLSAVYFLQVVKYSRVYGSLGAIPVFMIGLYLAWAIILIGAEVASTVGTPDRDPAPFPDSPRERERITLEVARVVAAHYREGRGGASIVNLLEALTLPLDWINRSLGTLMAAGLLVEAAETEEDDSGPRYLPARPLTSIRVLDVVAAVRGTSSGRADTSAEVEGLLTELATAEDAALGTVTLEDLVRGRAGR